MLGRRAKQIATAGLVLAGADLAWAQAPARPVPSPYHVRPAGGPVAGPDPLLLPGPAGPLPCYEGTQFPGLAMGERASWGYLLAPACPAPGAPLGETIGAHFRAQVGNGSAARMTLYDYDFASGSAQLSYRGRDRLRVALGLMAQSPYPLVIEGLPLAPDLAAARRAAVLAELAAAGVVVPPERVLVGPPLAVPLRGVEAELIYQTLLTQTGTAGIAPGASPAGGSRTVSPPGSPQPPISR
jgi:hypothetical protein